MYFRGLFFFFWAQASSAGVYGRDRFKNTRSLEIQEWKIWLSGIWPLRHPFIWQFFSPKYWNKTVKTTGTARSAVLQYSPHKKSSRMAILRWCVWVLWNLCICIFFLVYFSFRFNKTTGTSMRLFFLFGLSHWFFKGIVIKNVHF